MSTTKISKTTKAKSYANIIPTGRLERLKWLSSQSSSTNLPRKAYTPDELEV